MKDERLSEMKHDYKNIPIPEELAGRVAASVNAAKKELAEASPLRADHISFPWPKRLSFRRMAAQAAGIAAAAALVITVAANSGERIAYAMGNIPVLGAIARVVTFREYSHSQEDMEAYVKVPTVSVEDTKGAPLDSTAELNEEIKSYTSQIIEAYEQDVAASQGKSRESLNLDYDIITDNDRFFTLRFDQTIVMADSMHTVKIYNLDKTTGKILSLKDLFVEDSDYIRRISDNIKKQMTAQMAADGDVSYFYKTDMPDLNFSEISEDENFYISEKGTLVLVFDKYQVAPGSMGSVEFEIPTDIISDIVKDGFVK